MQINQVGPAHHPCKVRLLLMCSPVHFQFREQVHKVLALLCITVLYMQTVKQSKLFLQFVDNQMGCGVDT